MKVELTCIDQTVDSDGIRKYGFAAAENNACLSVPSGLLSFCSDFKDHIKLASLISFPYGISETRLRIHEILNSIRMGANYIDLVINNTLISNLDFEAIRKDFRACMEVCSENDIPVRPVIEYKLYPFETILKLCRILGEFNVNCVINATGKMPDDLADNAIISHQIINKTGLNVIACGRIWTPEHIELYTRLDVEAIRVTSITTLEKLKKNLT